MSQPMISVNDVSMLFNLNRDRVFSAKEYVIKALQRKLFYDEFWALKNMSFDVQRGEILGIMGLNGSGKSTLLKLISGVFKPTRGEISVNGSIVPLLELGTGFDPEFSAKENVYMNGALYGHPPAHMATIYNEIMDFAELWDFENVPIKNFSSGMQARLGFAVATAVRPEILILDEVLGVGDFRFVQKCEALISEILSGETTVLLVSHDVDTIMRMCTRAMIISKGEMVCIGEPAEVCRAYHEEVAPPV